MSSDKPKMSVIYKHVVSTREEATELIQKIEGIFGPINPSTLCSTGDAPPTAVAVIGTADETAKAVELREISCGGVALPLLSVAIADRHGAKSKISTLDDVGALCASKSPDRTSGGVALATGVATINGRKGIAIAVIHGGGVTMCGLSKDPADVAACLRNDMPDTGELDAYDLPVLAPGYAWFKPDLFERVMMPELIAWMKSRVEDLQNAVSKAVANN